MVHGTQQRMATASARAGARSIADRCARHAPQAAQPSKTGSAAPSAGLVINANPQSKPYNAQSRVRAELASFSVNQSNTDARSAESEASQIHPNGIIPPF